MISCDTFVNRRWSVTIAVGRRAACVEGQDESTSVRFSRCAPYTLCGVLVLTFHTRFHYVLSPLNLLPMFPNDCYPCARPKQRSVMATLGYERSGVSRPV